jgi:hypothetical protein
MLCNVSSGPPLPTLPDMCFGPGPELVGTAKSLLTSPLTLSARTSALLLAGSVAVIAPLTASTRDAEVKSAKETSTRPLMD